MLATEGQKITSPSSNILLEINYSKTANEKSKATNSLKIETSPSKNNKTRKSIERSSSIDQVVSKSQVKLLQATRRGSAPSIAVSNLNDLNSPNYKLETPKNKTQRRGSSSQHLVNFLKDLDSDGTAVVSSPNPLSPVSPYSFADYSKEETRAFTTRVNYLLKDDSLVSSYLPMDVDSQDLFNKLEDGLILIQLINLIQPGTIPDKQINKMINLNIFQRQENLNLALSSAKQIGCVIVNIGGEDIIEKRKHLVLGLMWQLIKLELLFDVKASSIDYLPELQSLKLGSENDETFRKLSAEQLLLRWINYHLQLSGEIKKITNFDSDMRDPIIFCHLLHQFDSNQRLPPLGASKLEIAAKAIESAQEVFSIPVFVQPEGMGGSSRLNLSFAAQIFNAYQERAKSNSLRLSKDEVNGDKRTEVIESSEMAQKDLKTQSQSKLKKILPDDEKNSPIKSKLTSSPQLSPNKPSLSSTLSNSPTKTEKLVKRHSFNNGNNQSSMQASSTNVQTRRNSLNNGTAGGAAFGRTIPVSRASSAFQVEKDQREPSKQQSLNSPLEKNKDDVILTSKDEEAIFKRVITSDEDELPYDEFQARLNAAKNLIHQEAEEVDHRLESEEKESVLDFDESKNSRYSSPSRLSMTEKCNDRQFSVEKVSHDEASRLADELFERSMRLNSDIYDDLFGRQSLGNNVVEFENSMPEAVVIRLLEDDSLKDVNKQNIVFDEDEEENELIKREILINRPPLKYQNIQIVSTLQPLEKNAFSVDIVSYRVERDPNSVIFLDYILYKVKVYLGSNTWALEKRFSEFHKLFKRLPLSQKFLAGRSIPEKTWFPVVFDDEFLNNRRVKLYHAFNKSLKDLYDQNLIENEYLMDFLDIRYRREV